MARRILPVLALIALLISVFSLGVFAEDTKGVIAVSSAKAKAGDTVTVSVTMEKNPGIYGMSLSLQFDGDNLQYSKITYGDVFSESEYMNSNGSVTNELIISPMNNDIANNTKTGKMLDIEFKTTKDTANGDYTIAIGAVHSITESGGQSVEIDGTPVNVDGEEVDFTYNNGKVTISGGAENKNRTDIAAANENSDSDKDSGNSDVSDGKSVDNEDTADSAAADKSNGDLSENSAKTDSSDNTVTTAADNTAANPTGWIIFFVCAAAAVIAVVISVVMKKKDAKTDSDSTNKE